MHHPLALVPTGRRPRSIGFVVACTLLLITASGPHAVSATGAVAPVTASPMLVYHELTAFPANVNTRGEEAPILSGDGRTIAFARAPGTENPATPNRIFVMDAGGSGEREIDRYPTFCYCGSALDISADGKMVISTDSVQLRIAAASGGGGRELLALDSNEINAARISGDGTKVVFRVHRDTSVRGSAPSRPIQRGIWIINADGSGLRQIVGPRQLVALGLPPTDFVGSGEATLDASTDGSRLVFATYHDPKDAGAGQGLFAVNLDGSGLHELVGRVPFVVTAALSGDGTTVAYSAIVGNDDEQVGALAFAGGAPRILLDRRQDLPVANGGLPASDDRLQLSTDGRLALLGSSGVLADTRTGELLALGVAGPTLAAGMAPLVGNGLYRATMDAGANHFLYLTADAKGILQLARLDRDPTDLESAPRLDEATVEPVSVRDQGGSAATVRVRVEAAGTLVGVGATVLRNGLADPHVAIVNLFDDGSHGDAAASDRVFTNSEVRTDCCAALGPRIVRVLAQTQGVDGKRHATAVDVGPFAVVGAAPTAPTG